MKTTRISNKFISIFLTVFSLPLLITSPIIHGYRFDVYPVDKCPMNKNEFNNASKKMECPNETRFLCAPNNNLSSLIEFCTDVKKSRFQEGNCVRLEGTGDLNHYNCEELFLYGCPNVSYVDEEIYNYPACLIINKRDRCFSAEKHCPDSTNYPGSLNDTTSDIYKDEAYNVQYGIFIAMALLSVATLILTIVFYKLQKRALERRKKKCGIEELRHFLSKQYVKVCHARCIIVGCAKAGKTTLLKRLQDKPYKEIINVEETHGVDVHINSFEVLEDTIRGVELNDTYEIPNILISVDDILNEGNGGDFESSKKDKKDELHKSVVESKSVSANDTEEEEGRMEENVELLTVDVVENDSRPVDSETAFGGPEIIANIGEINDDSEIENYAMSKIMEAVHQLGKERTRKPRITFLDFAGQNAYYAFHQIYFSPKTFYILVVDMSKKFTEKNEMDERGVSRFTSWTYEDYYKFWLKSIDSFSDIRTPVIVIATHAEDKSKQDCRKFFDDFFALFDGREDLQRHLHTERIFFVKLPKTGSKLEDVDEIKKCISTLSQAHWEENMRSAWAIFEHIVEKEKLERKIISRDKLLQYNESLKPEFKMCEEEITEMLLFLHRVGAVLYIDEENVRNTIILDVQWFVNAFKYIITDSVSLHETTDKERKRFYNTGELFDDELEEIWRKHYEENKDFFRHKNEILSFMEQLGLLAICHPDKPHIPGSGTWYYFPCMNKRRFHRDEIKKHTRSSILCFQFDEQGQLPIFLFYSLVLKCLKLPGWRFATEEGKRCIYDNVACFCFKEHSIVVLCLCNFQIQVQVCVPEDNIINPVDLKTIKQSIEMKLQEFRKYSYRVGYKCQKGLLYDENDNTFIEQESVPPHPMLCNKCRVREKHELDDSISWVKTGKLMGLENRPAYQTYVEQNDEGFASIKSIWDSCIDGNTENFFFHLKNEIRGREHLLKKSDIHNWNALHFAAKGGNHKIFAALMSENLDILQKTNQQMTVLHIAAQHSNYDICKAILENDGFRNLLKERSCQGKNACHYAAESGSCKILELLAANKEMNVKETTNDGQNIFHIACIHGKLDMCQFIAKNYEELIFANDSENWNATLYAAKQGHTDILEFLKVNNVSFSNKSESKRNALHIACDNGHYSACEFIIKVCPSLLEEIDYKGRHAGHFAARSGSVAIMKFLRKMNLKVTKSTLTGMNILHTACLHRRKEMCLYLLNTFPYLNGEKTEKGWTTAHFVAKRDVNAGNEIEIFKIIKNAKEKCKIDAVTNKGNSILTLAIKNNFYEFCEYLLQTYPNILKIPGVIHPMDIENKDSKMTAIIERYCS